MDEVRSNEYEQKRHKMNRIGPAGLELPSNHMNMNKDTTANKQKT